MARVPPPPSLSRLSVAHMLEDPIRAQTGVRELASFGSVTLSSRRWGSRGGFSMSQHQQDLDLILGGCSGSEGVTGTVASSRSSRIPDDQLLPSSPPSDSGLLAKVIDNRPTPGPRRPTLRPPPKPVLWRRGCTRELVSKMGNRTLPLHVPDKPEDESPEKFRARVAGTERPRCRLYEEWVEQKRVLQEEALSALTLADLVYIHTHCEPGQIDTSLHWNAVAKRARESQHMPCWKVTEDSVSSGISSASTQSSVLFD